jgi:hypothetical protein
MSRTRILVQLTQTVVDKAILGLDEQKGPGPDGISPSILRNGCSYVPNFRHSKVLIKMTDKMPLLLAPRDKFVTLNIFDRKFSVDFPTRDNWSTECVNLVPPDGIVFFTDGSLCEG